MSTDDTKRSRRRLSTTGLRRGDGQGVYAEVLDGGVYGARDVPEFWADLRDERPLNLATIAR